MVDTKEISKLLAEFSTLNITDLWREGQDIDFVDIKEQLSDAFTDIKNLNDHKSYLTKLSQAQINNFASLVKQLLDTIFSIQKFDAKSQNSIDIRNQFATMVREITSDLSVKFLKDFKLYFLESQVSKSQLTSLKKRYEAVIKEAVENREQVDKLLEAVKSASRETGTITQGQIFAQEAKKQKRMAIFWGILLLIATGITITFLWDIFDKLLVPATSESTSSSVILQVLITKLFVVSIFTYALHIIAKNFHASMHLYTLNTHRDNSLRTFQTFYQSAENERIRTAILLQVTNTVFGAGSTGYVRSKEDLPTMDLLNKVLDNK